eukprot:CAMPEP_0179147194 /NCGR_PEP_ID=MMETSP0796-20121207/71140_1 /TAXON_ID=73915 /ORGANISM="Pyrodinium bahamense, Strain pbaha01" /LENGTH=770 /DNA_ID=CAMNT_0020847769 /DNA_START=29 /DNA_END=2341 /DNA_ORIENTATION=-
MKSTRTVGAAVLGVLTLAAPALGLRASSDSSIRTAAGDRTITKVVKLLQSMLDNSKAEGETERNLYAKFKCYCDHNEDSKKQDIKELTEEISLLESGIEKLLASSAILSTEVAQLQDAMEKNVEARDKAQALRNQENAAFLALEADLDDAILKMGQAIQVLAAIGADQAMGQAARDHETFMANYQPPAGLLRLKSTVKQALIAASGTASKREASSIEAFLQAPFTAAYTAQAGEVVGILKDMNATFSNNLASARTQEKVAYEAHTKYKAAMEKAYDEIRQEKQSKEGVLSANDSSLGTKRSQLADAETKKSDAETFLSQLVDMCIEKAKQYEGRLLLRTNEEAAITEAISILNSDDAFDLFGKVTATRSGPTALFQETSVHRRAHTPKKRVAQRKQDAQREQAQAALRMAAGSQRSSMLSKVLALLQANNPFAIVLEEIDKMIALITAEEEADSKNLAWCTGERQTNNDFLTEKQREITSLEQGIETLNGVIDAPETGLKDIIQEDEGKLQENSASQKLETKSRTEENLAYQKNIDNLVGAQALLTKAITVLQAYYAKIVPGFFLDVSRSAQPAPPPTWTGDYKGQSEQGTGQTGAIGMLQYILQNTHAEEAAAHDAEKTAQHAFEDSMSELKEEEKRLELSLGDNRLLLAEKEEERVGLQKDLKTTKVEKAAIEAYLLKIKPGCDFIVGNIEARSANRQEEQDALENATEQLKGSPAYQEAMMQAHNESLGECLETCAGAEENVECLACMAHVTVPAYCAGHPETEGCF